MRIAFLLPNLKAGGGNRSQIMLANGLAEKGHDVAILVPRGQVSDMPMEVKVKILEKGFPLKSSYLNVIANYPLLGLNSACYDVVVVTFSLMTWTTFLPCCISGAKRYLFARHYDPFLLDNTKINSAPMLGVYKSLTRFSYELPFQLIVNSEWTGKTISENIFRKKPYRIINNGVDISAFHPENHSNIKKHTHLKQIVTLGKKQKWKGLKDVFATLEILSQKESDFELVVITQDDINIDDGLHYNIRTVRPTSDEELADIYRNTDVFVSASWYEGFCNPPLEAMACGAPVVLTDSGGVREYAINEYNCLMSPPQKPERLADNIFSILNNKALAEKLAANGLKTAMNFQWQKSIDEFEKIICQKNLTKAL